MGNRSINTKDIVVGALLGALLAGASSKFLTSKSGKKIKRDLTNKYNHARSNVHDFMETLNDKKRKVGEKAEDFSEKAKGTYEYIKEELSALADEDHGNARLGLVLGALLGAVVAAGATHLINNRDEEENFLEKASSNISGLKKLLSGVLETVEHNGASVVKEPSHFINDALELATKGIHLWQKIKTR